MAKAVAIDGRCTPIVDGAAAEEEERQRRLLYMGSHPAIFGNDYCIRHRTDRQLVDGARAEEAQRRRRAELGDQRRRLPYKGRSGKSAGTPYVGQLGNHEATSSAISADACRGATQSKSEGAAGRHHGWFRV